MRRQSFRAQLVVSGIFVGTLMAALAALFFQTPLSLVGYEKNYPHQAVRISPAPGHWLKTAADSWYHAIPVNYIEREQIRNGQTDMPAYTLERAKTALNRVTDSINIMYLWSDGDKLKVISVTGFNRVTKKAAVVVIPLDVVVNGGNTVNLTGRQETMRDLYRQKGREGIRRFLEQRLEIAIPNYVHVNQGALRKLSEIIGELSVNGDRITMLEAFEETAAGIRTDDPEVVKTVGSQVLQPRMLLEVPRLVWIFTHDIRTNFTPEEMINLFHTSRQMDLQNMRKATLPGIEFIKWDTRLLFVSEQTWKNIIYEITQ